MFWKTSSLSRYFYPVRIFRKIWALKSQKRPLILLGFWGNFVIIFTGTISYVEKKKGRADMALPLIFFYPRLALRQPPAI
jgi:hypothetical protein